MREGFQGSRFGDAHRCARDPRLPRPPHRASRARTVPPRTSRWPRRRSPRAPSTSPRRALTRARGRARRIRGGRCQRVNRARLAPGDGVLFQGGRTFSDDALMPQGSGASGAPIVFGSYGSGEASITQGVWFVGSDWLTFDNLSLGPEAGLQGGNDGGRRADHIRVQRCTISLTAANPAPGINATGDNWTIAATQSRTSATRGCCSPATATRSSATRSTAPGQDAGGLRQARDLHEGVPRDRHPQHDHRVLIGRDLRRATATARSPTTASPTGRSGSRSSNTTSSPARAIGARIRSPAPPPPGTTCRRPTRPDRRSRAS